MNLSFLVENVTWSWRDRDRYFHFVPDRSEPFQIVPNRSRSFRTVPDRSVPFQTVSTVHHRDRDRFNRDHPSRLKRSLDQSVSIGAGLVPESAFCQGCYVRKRPQIFLGNYTDIQGLNQTKKRVRVWSEGIRDRFPVRDNKKYSIFYWEYFWAISTQVRTEHALLLPMNLMCEPLANYVKSLDCQCELSSKARTKTGNVLLLLIRVPTNNW